MRNWNGKLERRSRVIHKIAIQRRDRKLERYLLAHSLAGTDLLENWNAPQLCDFHRNPGQIHTSPYT